MSCFLLLAGVSAWANNERVFMVKIPEHRVVRVDWLAGLDRSPGRVGLSSCPGRIDVGGNVAADVQHLLSLEISTVVSLVTDAEMEYYGVVGLRPALRAAKIEN